MVLHGGDQGLGLADVVAQRAGEAQGWLAGAWAGNGAGGVKFLARQGGRQRVAILRERTENDPLSRRNRTRIFGTWMTMTRRHGAKASLTATGPFAASMP